MKLPHFVRVLKVAAIAYGVTVIGPPADAGPVGHEFVVDTAHLESFPARPVLAGLADGGFVIVSAIGHPLNSPKRLVAQRFGANGERLSGKIVVGKSPSSDFRVVGLADGGFLAVWHSFLGPGEGWEEILAHRFDQNGKSMGGPFVANTTRARHQHFPDATDLRGGGYAIAWQEVWRSQARTIVQRFHALGTPEGPPVQLALESGRESPAIAQLRDGSVIATWAKEGAIFGQRISSSGALGDVFRIVRQDNKFWRICCQEIETLDEDRLLFVWYNSKRDNLDDGDDVFAFIYNDAKRKESFIVNSHRGKSHTNPVACRLKDGGFVVTWNRASVHRIAYYGIYYRRFDRDALPIGGDKRVDNSTRAENYRPGIACLRDGGFVIAWVSVLGEKREIRGQRFSAVE